MSFLSDDALLRLRGAGQWPEFTDERFSALEEIGRGGMGTVFRASDATLGREVAIKVAGSVTAGSGLEARLRAEAAILARLEHPGIVPVHEVGRLADGRPFVVMKLVRGETLDRHLAKIPELAGRLRIFERICEPVSFAHAHGLVHRDLKPANVMIGAFGEVLVMDWGVAKRLDVASPEAAAGPGGAGPSGPATASGTVVGTRGYMAPEQARASGVDERADVYALGAILATLLSGAPPGDAAGPVARAPEWPGHVPRPLRAVCARALAEDPAERYPSVEALAGDVARFRAGLPVRAHRENPLERAGRVLYRYRAAALLIAAYLVMRAIVALLLRR